MQDFKTWFTTVDSLFMVAKCLWGEIVQSHKTEHIGFPQFTLAFTFDTTKSSLVLPCGFRNASYVMARNTLHSGSMEMSMNSNFSPLNAVDLFSILTLHVVTEHFTSPRWALMIRSYVFKTDFSLFSRPFSAKAAGTSQRILSRQKTTCFANLKTCKFCVSTTRVPDQ